MNKKKYDEFLKRYDKFKKNNLPTPFWDDERQTYEYVYYEEDNIHISSSIYESLSRIALTELYYPFNSKMVTYKMGEEPKIEYGHNHAHSFEEVVDWLYCYPESFNLDDECLEFYSKQELEYLRRVQKYLLFIGMKDIEGAKTKITRYRSKKQKKYINCLMHNYSNKTIEDLLSGKRNFTYREVLDKDEKEEIYDDYQVLILDEEDNFKMHIKYTHSKIKKYKEIKDIVNDNRFKDNDMMRVRYLEILEKF